ncbi:peptidoglycan-binding domain-containing protein [Calothrix sp. UHCC 0171]|uniref:peptidoglycan-binding domain-containing protein n=1 Tax=Calothrix sp. UHCC 0171 TaxID=3110245 RepID=UPI002B20F866|nr:peptidoglycan-binding domain-containing protein [Calothrix sp. UHCC 0171]MEA5570012.1 peptidoglycan-binding domain-containing protein [Calothrix sp. UHCC 0171]
MCSTFAIVLLAREIPGAKSMKDKDKLSIFNYLKSFIPFSFFHENQLFGLLLCSSVPLLVASPSVASITVAQEIVQASPAAMINRPSLKSGSQGEAVTELQAALKLLGFYNGAVDGKYGDTTVAAVASFKQAAGLTPDGVVDTTTWQRLFPSQENMPTITSSSLPAPTTSATNRINTTTTTNITSNKFPVPSQTTANTAANLPRPVVVPTSQPKPNNQQLETVRTTSVTRTNTANSLKPSNRSTPAQNSSSTASARTRTTTTSRSGGNTTSTSTNNRTAATTNRYGRTTMSSTSTTTTRSPRVRPEQQKPGIQYTAIGFPILRLGMRGEEVYELQRRLKSFGYLKNDPDGDFGVVTETAVKALQQRFGIKADGIAGGETWEILTRQRQ